MTDDDQELDHWERRVGFRTVHNDTTPDDAGAPFVLHVSDEATY
jgi:beta-mannosidase